MSYYGKGSSSKCSNHVLQALHLKSHEIVHALLPLNYRTIIRLARSCLTPLHHLHNCILLNCATFQVRFKKSMSSFKFKYGDILTISVCFLIIECENLEPFIIKSILQKHQQRVILIFLGCSLRKYDVRHRQFFWLYPSA